MGGGVSKMAKQELVATIRDRYRQSSKKDKGRNCQGRRDVGPSGRSKSVPSRLLTFSENVLANWLA